MINKNKKGISKWRIILIILGIAIVFLIADFILARALWARQVDDFSPQIYCEKEIIEKSEILMVIPLYNNISIAENKTWCQEILALNKTLGMHGVYHTFQEFLEIRDEDYIKNGMREFKKCFGFYHTFQEFLEIRDENYIKNGMREFKKCFGFYPTLFEAPQLALSKDNEVRLGSLNMSINHHSFNFFHKVYHCSDTGSVKNGIIDII
ncbi:DUF2334 domain-containing protein [Candidatus Pacearchaeota archaeon]|nr:DUF2334 domain-containing protein [Candidatus Pacearchaeota archaeon]